MNDSFQNKKILIAGGLGFIGSNLARKLVSLGAKVQIIDALVPESGGNLFNVQGIENQIDIHIADVRNESEISSVVKGQDYLFNLIGQNSHLDSMKEPHADLELNCRSQLSILEACRKIDPSPKIIFTSTRQIYGRPESLPVHECHPLLPVDINGVHKLAGEWYHRIYAQNYDLRVCILRLTNTYGPRMRIKDSRQTFLGWWIHEMIGGNEFQIFGNGDQLRDFTFVEDAVQALLLTAQREEINSQIFNLSGDGPVSLEGLAKLLIRLHGSGSYRLIPFPEDLKLIDIGDYYADATKINSMIGWRPKIGLEEGLLKTLRFFKAHLKQDQLEQHVDATL